MTQLSTGYVVTVHSSSNLIPAALVLALEDVSDEKYEGVLIATQGTVTETVHDDSFGEYVISSYADNSIASVRVNDRFAVTNPAHGSNVSITGIMNQWGGSSSSPPAWRLEPVKEADCPAVPLPALEIVASAPVARARKLEFGNNAPA